MVSLCCFGFLDDLRFGEDEEKKDEKADVKIIASDADKEDCNKNNEEKKEIEDKPSEEKTETNSVKDEKIEEKEEKIEEKEDIKDVDNKPAEDVVDGGNNDNDEAKKPEEKDLISIAEKGGQPGEYLGRRVDDSYSDRGPSPHVVDDRGFSPTEENYDNRGYQTESPTHTVSDVAAYTPVQGDEQEAYREQDEEHLFDVSDLQQEHNLISKCGQLEVSFQYEGARGRMNITVLHAKDIPAKDRGGANSTQIRMLLLPTKKQRHKTKIKNGENPIFQEHFSFKVPPDEISNMGVRFRLYGCERMRRERMIGESVVGFASLNLDIETTHCLALEPRSNISHGDSKLDVSSLSRSDSASSTQSMQHGGMPELLVGLSYNGTTGRLSVEIIKGSNFRNMAMNRAPDTYVKLTLMTANCQELARSKTSIRRGQPNPLFKETFMFQVALFQLQEVTLMVSVYNKRSMKRKEMIGWFSSGLNSSGEEELSHWKDMVDSKGEQVCRWHVLLEA